MKTIHHHCLIPSPIGLLTLVASAQGLTGIFMDTHPNPIPADSVADDSRFREARSQLAAYFAGGLKKFDLPLDPKGTPFQLSVWRALLEIPFGETISYGEQARRIGRPKAVRAVGLANGANPLSIVIPCHRVIGKNGSLTGYGGGLERKRFLLGLESALNRET